MSDPKSRVGAVSIGIVFLFHALLLAYPLLSLFWRRSYPLATPEVGILFLLALLLALLLAALQIRASQWWTVVVAPLTMGFVALVQFDPSVQVFVLSVGVMVLLAWRLKNRLYAIGLPVIMALLVGAYLDSNRPPAYERAPEIDGAAPDVPAVVHIILDGFGSVEGLPPYPASQVLKDEVYAFLQAFGLQAFPRAYSHYSNTGESLYSAFNFTDDNTSTYAREALLRQDHALTSNAYFERFEQSGFRLNVYQTEHIDFCGSNPDFLNKCWSYMQPNMAALRAFDDLPLKLRMILGIMMKQSQLLSAVLVGRSWLINRQLPNHDPRIFAEMAADITSAGEGHVYFAHVLLPHGPFSYLNDCSINTRSPALIRGANFEGEEAPNPEVVEWRHLLYYEQIDCALGSLAALFNEMKAAELFERSAIIIHGDHGSQITKYQGGYTQLAEMRPEDLRARFSTFFAFKAPFGEFGVDERVVPLDVLMEAVSRAIRHYVETGTPGSLFAGQDDGAAPLPQPFIYLRHNFNLRRVDIDIYEDPPEAPVGQLDGKQAPASFAPTASIADARATRN